MAKKKLEVIHLVCAETGDQNYTLRRKSGGEKLKLKKYSPRPDDYVDLAGLSRLRTWGIHEQTVEREAEFRGGEIRGQSPPKRLCRTVYESAAAGGEPPVAEEVGHVWTVPPPPGGG